MILFLADGNVQGLRRDEAWLSEEWRSEKGWKREAWNSSRGDWLLNSIILEQSLVFTCVYCSTVSGILDSPGCPFPSVHGTIMDIYNRPGATVACWIQPPGSKWDPELTPSATCEKLVSSRVIRTYHKQTAWCVQTGSGFLHVSSGIRWWKQPWELK